MLPYAEELATSIVCHSVLDGAGLVLFLESSYELAAPVACVLLSRGINDVYLVTAGGARFILRVSPARRYGPFDEQAYCFELDLLRFLQGRGLSIAAAVQRRDGALLGAIATPEGPRFCALFHHVEGRAVSALTAEQGEQLGLLTAQLHQATEGFSSLYRRFALDAGYLIAEPLRLLETLPCVSRADAAFLAGLGAELTAQIEALPALPHAYGVVHGDIWWRNVHFDGAQPVLFDFDYCGYGWRVIDLAALRGNALMYGLDLPAEVPAAMLRGYQAIRPLDEAELAALPAFEQITVIWAFGVWASCVEVFGLRWFEQRFPPAIAALKTKPRSRPTGAGF